MADDFARLVSSANPAANTGYQSVYPPPSRKEQNLLDPFFDDDDIIDADSPTPYSSRTNIPQHAAPPAGTEGAPQGWTFDESIQPQAPPPDPPKKPRKKWRWPWQKEEEAKGDRVIAFNNAAANIDFSSNFVSTSKYNIATFIPKFLAGWSAYMLY